MKVKEDSYLELTYIHEKQSYCSYNDESKDEEWCIYSRNW